MFSFINITNNFNHLDINGHTSTEINLSSGYVESLPTSVKVIIQLPKDHKINPNGPSRIKYKTDIESSIKSHLIKANLSSSQTSNIVTYVDFITAQVAKNGQTELNGTATIFDCESKPGGRCYLTKHQIKKTLTSTDKVPDIILSITHQGE